jgi:hypothetical protein
VGDANFDDNTLYVDATNNRVGIGTVSPSVKLHIEGGNIFAKKGSSSILFDEYNNGSILWMDGSDGDVTGGDYWGVYAQSSTLWGVNYAGGNNILNITSSGNVGIGTDAITGKLHIVGNTPGPEYRGFIYTNNSSATLTNESLFQAVAAGYSSNSPIFLFRDDRSDQQTTQRIFELQGARSGVGTILTTLANGNVGIGTSSPSAKLEVSGGDVNFDSGTLYVDATNNRVGIGKTPSYLLDLYKEQTMSTTVDRALQVQDILTYSGTGAKYQQTIFASARQLVPTSSSNTGYLRGITFDVTTGYGEAGNSGSLAEITGMQFQVGIESDNGNAPTVTNVTGLNIWPFYQSGSITNLYGIKLQSASTGGSVTNYYGIYQEDANADNYFNGDVGIGTTTPQNKLDVEGGAVIGATYSGTNTAPTNGLLVEGNVGIGTTSPRVASGGYNNLVIDGPSSGLFEINANGTRVVSLFGSGNDINIVNPNATGAMRFYTADTERMRINSSGNVGIGTTSPTEKLDVNGKIYVEDEIIGYLAGQTGYRTYAKNARFHIVSYQSVVGGNFTKTFDIVANADAGADSEIRFLTTLTSSSPTERMRITSAGNVGIGTNSPGEKFVVNGNGVFARIANTNASAVGGIKISYQNSNTHGLHLLYNPSDAISYIDNTYPISSGQVFGDIQFRQNVSGSMTQRMIIKAENGNVGIGTTNPLSKLQVGTRGTSSALSLGVADAILFDFYNDNSPFKRHGVIISQAADASESVLDFNTKAANGTNTTKMTILGNGNVGIGTTTPAANLDVNGSGRFNGSLIVNTGNILSLDQNYNVHGYLKFSVTDFGSENSFGMYGYYGLAFQTRQGIGIVLKGNSNNVGIGTTSPSTKLEVNGTATVTTIVETSALRFKENINTIEDTSIIDKLRPVSFDWKDSKETEYGFIAEEVYDLDTTLVTKSGEDELQGVKYTKLIPLLVKKVQEQDKQINKLKDLLNGNT